MENKKPSVRARAIASIFLLAVMAVCLESVSGLHNAATEVLAALVGLVSTFFTVSLVAGILTEKRKEGSD